MMGRSRAYGARWLLAATALVWLAAEAPTAQAISLNGVALDPGGEIRPALLSEGLRALQRHAQARRDVLVLVDFSLPSDAARFFVLDLKTGAVQALRTAHGKGSDLNDDRLPERFSNVEGSLASSLGGYLVQGRYVGKHGLSLRLVGLDPSNDLAERRAIVLHGADYMREDFIRRFGRPGRSFGCFVLDPDELAWVVERLEHGALIYAGS